MIAMQPNIGYNTGELNKRALTVLRTPSSPRHENRMSVPMSYPDHTPSNVDPTIFQRFYSKVEANTLFDCWIWKGSVRGQYGEILFCGHKESAHRVSWILQNGEIPDGLCVLHRCDNPLCVNPSHLFLGTQRANMRDKVAKGRANTPKGVACKNSKLTDDDVREIRKLIDAGYTHRYIGQMFGISNVAVSYIRNKRTWNHIG